MIHWLTVEVFDAGAPASTWRHAWLDPLVQTALGCGADYWDDHEHRWGVVLEIAFPTEQARDAFRRSPVLGAAIDAAPDVLVYPHRGGGAGDRVPRRPVPFLDSGAVALPEDGQELSGAVETEPFEQVHHRHAELADHH